MTTRDAIVGVLPAAGRARRLHPFTYPKELLPIGYSGVPGTGQHAQPRLVIEHSMDLVRTAEIECCAIIVNFEKLEIARYVGSGHPSLSLGYFLQPEPRGLVDAVDAAYPWFGGRSVALALPDTVIEPTDALRTLRSAYESSELDLVLGLFPTDSPEKLGPVDASEEGVIARVYDKPAQTRIWNTWGLAIWSPRFTELLHEVNSRADGPSGELAMGSVFQLAVESGLRARAVRIVDGSFNDLGTPSSLGKVVTAERLTRLPLCSSDA